MSPVPSNHCWDSNTKSVLICAVLHALVDIVVFYVYFNNEGFRSTRQIAFWVWAVGTRIYVLMSLVVAEG